MRHLRQLLDRGHDPALGDRGGRAHGLGEEADPELFDLPADLGGGVGGPGLGGGGREGGLVGVLYAVDDGHLLCVAAGVVGELVEAAAYGLDVAGEGGEAGGAGGGEEAGGDEAVELGLDVDDGGL